MGKGKWEVEAQCTWGVDGSGGVAHTQMDRKIYICLYVCTYGQKIHLYVGAHVSRTTCTTKLDFSLRRSKKL